MKQSTRFTLNKNDVLKWARNTALFFAPAAILFLMQLQAGKTWQEAVSVLYLWAINTLIDILRKFIAGK